MHLALTDLFRARWSEMIHEEWIRSVLRDRTDLQEEQLHRTRDLMDRHIRDAVVTGFEELIESFDLPDPHDRHVLAAAVRAGADAIITFNAKDFPPDRLLPYNVEVIHPDDFIVSQLNLAPTVVLTAVKRHRASLKNPPKSVEDYLDCLRAQRLTQTASELAKSTELI